MRFSLYAPILGLSAMAALAQNSPRGLNTTPYKLTSPPVMQEVHVPRLTCELCAAAVPVREKQGANRGAIERAIRALGARVFPGNRPADGARGGNMRLDRQPGFRIIGAR